MIVLVSDCCKLGLCGVVCPGGAILCMCLRVTSLRDCLFVPPRVSCSCAAVSMGDDAAQAPLFHLVAADLWSRAKTSSTAYYPPTYTQVRAACQRRHGAVRLPGAYHQRASLGCACSGWLHPSDCGPCLPAACGQPVLQVSFVSSSRAQTSGLSAQRAGAAVSLASLVNKCPEMPGLVPQAVLAAGLSDAGSASAPALTLCALAAAPPLLPWQLRLRRGWHSGGTHSLAPQTMAALLRLHLRFVYREGGPACLLCRLVTQGLTSQRLAPVGTGPFQAHSKRA